MVASDEFCTSTAKVVGHKVELLISLPWHAPQMHRHNQAAGYLELAYASLRGPPFVVRDGDPTMSARDWHPTSLFSISVARITVLL